MMEFATEDAAKAETYVFWDIKGFPVPRGFDARRVRPCINRFLAEHGYSGGPLTIFATGILTDVHDDTLRALSSAGISLIYDPCRMHSVMSRWLFKIQPPANIVGLCGDPYLFPPKQSGYNFLSPLENDTSLWESSILADSGSHRYTSETGEYASWYCFLCCDVSGQDFESFISHISSREHTHTRLDSLPVNDYIRAEKFKVEDIYPFDMVQRTQPERFDRWRVTDYIYAEKFDGEAMIPANKVATQEAAVAVTSVFWDIKRFPVPPDFDAQLVRPCIKRFLENYGYSGPLTIYAVGILTDVHDDILRALSSTGISLHYAPYGPTDTMLQWLIQNPPPANIVGLIDPKRFPPLLETASGYNIIRPFTFSNPGDDFSLWKSSILADSGALEEDTSCESANWYCFICNVHGQGFESFDCHLSSREHITRRLDCLHYKGSKRAEKFEGEDMYPFDTVNRNQPKRLHDAPTKQPKATKKMMKK